MAELHKIECQIQRLLECKQRKNTPTYRIQLFMLLMKRKRLLAEKQ